jgi:CheY-like chemotaxis protein
MPMVLVCLIGESDPFVGRLLQRFAEEMGLQAQWTTVSQDLVELARQRRPAVIIFEPELPGRLRGWEAAKLLKSDLETRAIPLVSCSWQTEADVRARLGEVCGHLQKPDLRFREFVAAMRAAGVGPGDGSTPT